MTDWTRAAESAESPSLVALTVAAVVAVGWAPVSATATVSVGGLCGDAPAVTVSGASAAGALVDGVPAATGPYRGSYPGLGPPYTVADDGPTFMLPPQSGSRTLTFRMKRSRTDRCVTAGPNETGVGPWALVTGNGGTVGWSSNYPFRIIGGPTLQYQLADASWTAPPQPAGAGVHRSPAREAGTHDRRRGDPGPAGWSRRLRGLTGRHDGGWRLR